jgi:amino acid efflux transporter
MHDRRLGVGTGVALYVGAVLGPGVLALPSLAARTAGPASILSWMLLCAVSVPVAAAFAALGARRPGRGGVAGFVDLAFGPHAAAVVGWWFYLAVPIGVVAGALAGARYVAAGAGTVPVAALLLAAALAANHVGLHATGRVQLMLIGLLVLLLVVGILAAAPDARAARLTPFAPHGPYSVLAATSTLYFGFAGWEAGSHLSADFAQPRLALPRVTALTLIVVSALYLGLAVTTVAVLGPAAGRSAVPLADLLARGLGGAAGPVTALVAVLLSLGAINTYLASAGRLGVALAARRALPGRLAGTPRRSLTLVAVPAAAVLGVAAAARLPLELLLRATSSCLAAVVLAGLAAGVVLLPRRSAVRRGAALGAACTAVVLLTTGWLILLPVAIAAAALGCRRAVRARDLAPRPGGGTPVGLRAGGDRPVSRR